MAVIDVDQSWDGTGSLDEHRQKAFDTIDQPGFGRPSASPAIRLRPKEPKPDAAIVGETEVTNPATELPST